MNLDKNKRKTGFAILAVAMFVGFLISGCAQQTPQAENQNLPDSLDITENVQTSKKSGNEQIQEEIELAIKDGTYIQNVTYQYHSGEETIEIFLRFEDDVVKEASITAVGDVHSYSKELIEAVDSQLPNLVIGKEISEIDIPANVAGSSLTTAAFKEHLQDLEQRY